MLSTLMAFLVPLLFFIIVVYVLFWLINQITIPIVRNVGVIILVVVAILAFVEKFGHFAGIH